MKEFRFDALLIASRPGGYGNDEEFTNKVMRSLRSTEILSSAVRGMNVAKKEPFMMRMKRLPAFTLIAIVLAALLLLSGSAYAAYQLLWPKPTVHVSTPKKSASGRDEVTLSLKQCGDSTLASQYELKKNATITPDQIAGVVQAHCELDAIGTWAQNTFPHDELYAQVNKQAHDTTMISTSMATHIKSRDNNSITFSGLPKYNQADTTLKTTANTRYIAGGKDVKADQITTNDMVVYITSDLYHTSDSTNCSQGCSIHNEYVSTTLQAVVKLSMPFDNYDQFAWQSLTERTACAGNPKDTCLSGFIGGIDLYDGSARSVPGKNEGKNIQGTVTRLNGNTVTIKSSSGSLFTITMPTDVIGEYNTTKAGQYGGQLVKLGSTLSVSYLESPDKHSKSLTSDMLIFVYLQTEAVGKSDMPAAY